MASRPTPAHSAGFFPPQHQTTTTHYHHQLRQAKLQASLDALKKDVARLADEADSARREASAGQACQLSLGRVDAELSSLRAALRDAEEALVPPRLARLARSASGRLADQWAALQADPSYGAAAAAASRTASDAAAAAAGAAARARAAAGPHAEKALDAAATAVAAAQAKAAQVVEELEALIGKQMRAAPALAPYADPVAVRLLALVVAGLPLLVLLPLLSALRGGGSGSGSGKAGGARGGRKGSSGSGGGVATRSTATKTRRA